MALTFARPVVWDGTSRQLVTGRANVAGLSLVNFSAVNLAVVELVDGTSALGDLVTTVVIPAGGGVILGPSATVLAYESGVWAVATSGAASGTIYLIDPNE